MAVILDGLTNLRETHDGLYRYIIGTDGSDIYIERFCGETSTQAPWIVSGVSTDRVLIAEGEYAGIAYFQGILIVDIAEIGTYTSHDSGKTWQER